MSSLAERARRVVRLLAGRSVAYAVAARAVDCLAVCSREGFGTWRTLERLRRGVTAPEAGIQLRLKNLQHPFTIRPRAEDVDTVINTIVREEWGQFEWPGNPPRWMIDAGAHIGDTAAYFLSRFASLTVVALEPDAANHTVAARNLEAYGERAPLLRAALWSHDGFVGVAGGGTGAHVAPGGAEVEAVSMRSLMRPLDSGVLDILKLDVEGAEEEIFGPAAQEWLPRIRLVVLETHGESALAAVRLALTQNGFGMERYRSVWYCRGPLFESGTNLSQARCAEGG